MQEYIRVVIETRTDVVVSLAVNNAVVWMSILCVKRGLRIPR